jgi:4-hydroxy-3-polyprenylbenzoate decarboxylase
MVEHKETSRWSLRGYSSIAWIYRLICRDILTTWIKQHIIAKAKLSVWSQEEMMDLIIGITGASGVIYGIRLLEILSEVKDVKTHLIISEAAEITLKSETDRSPEDIRQLADYSYGIGVISAPISSGSFRTDGMIIAPCTIKTMSAISSSYNENLMVRAGDVTLKERRKLVLVVRESPLHLGHLRHMERLTEMGAVILPPVPAFYTQPQSIQDIVDYTVGKMLDIFDIEHNLFKRWSGNTPE